MCAKQTLIIRLYWRDYKTDNFKKRLIIVTKPIHDCKRPKTATYKRNFSAQQFIFTFYQFYVLPSTGKEYL